MNPKPPLRRLDTEKGGTTPARSVDSPDPTAGPTQSSLLNNPLSGKTEAELRRDVDLFVEQHAELVEIRDLLYKAAVIAQDRDNFDRLPYLDEDERAALRMEKTHRWKQRKTLYYQIFMCSMAAVTLGMDETVINGANLFWPDQFGIGGDSTHDTLLLGLVTAAPYLCCCVCSCWLSIPLNRYYGRRGAIFFSAVCAFIGVIWNALTNSWWHLLIARILLGFGIGPSSSTVSVLAAEVSPAPIRGAMAMQWQTWTAFGITLGTISNLIFKDVADPPSGITGLRWRLMLGSACLPAIVVMSQVWFTPESPRWLMSKNRHADAWKSLLRLRRTRIQAAIDLFYTAKCLEVEEELAKQRQRSRVVELLATPGNRRAFRASTIVMFLQQFCGINAIGYYSSTIFRNAGQSITTSLLGSLGFGIIIWLGSFPAFITLDRAGRRTMLLATLPILSILMFITGSGFYIEGNSGRLAMVIAGTYLFAAFYGSGAGAVPFSYSAEVYPLQVREIGMSWATAVTWCFNFVNALVFPLQISTWGSPGAFYWFGAWNILLWFLVLLFCPETKQYTLEELDQVFSMSTARMVAYGASSPAYWFKRYVLRQRIHRVALHNFHPSEEKDRGEFEHREKV
ncbi:hypothetical protein JCM8097_002035 [Rhodosporidiobolus ruineniae]